MLAGLGVSFRTVKYAGFVKRYFICSTFHYYYVDLAGQNSFCPAVLSASLSWEYSQAYFCCASLVSGSAVSALADCIHMVNQTVHYL